MTIRGTMMLLTLLASCPAIAQGGKELTIAERQLQNLIATIPIKTAETSPELREKLRSQGQPVMLVLGRPGYLYRDYVRASEQSAPSLRIPQENPDVHGCVTVSFEIRPDGKTDGFEVAKSDPAGMFDKHAVRAVYATEYEPSPATMKAGPAPRHQRSIWFLVARPPRGEFSKLNDAVEDERNKRREVLRAACEGPAP